MPAAGARRLAVLLAVALTISNTSAAFGLSPQSDEELEIAAALHFRAGFGLSTELAHVSALEHDPAADRTYSVPLSPAEVADLDQRMVVQNALEPMVEYARLFPETFAGFYVDQEAGGIVYFGFTTGLAERSAVLMSMAPSGADIRFVDMQRSESQLDALVDVVLHDSEYQASLSIAVHDVGTNVPANSVDIFVEPHSPEVSATLEQRYGPGTRIYPGTAPQLTVCESRDNCGPPIRAGVSNDWNCTVGFGVVEDGHRRMLTAGHCVDQVVDLYGWGGWEWFHNTTSLGLSSDHSWYYDSTADAGTMGNVPSTVHTNNVLGTLPYSWDITSQQSPTVDGYGYMVCQSGQVSEFRCGKILSTNRSPTYQDGTRMIKQRLADYFVQGGDSGAPVISSSNRNMAVGLQSGMDAPNLAFYSHIGHVEAELSLQISFSE